MPHRKDFEPDFVNRIPDFTSLGLYEATPDFVPPAPSEGIRSIHFRHYPRPAQGFLDGKKTLGLMLILVSPREESGAQALRDWAESFSAASRRARHRRAARPFRTPHGTRLLRVQGPVRFPSLAGSGVLF